MERRIQSLDDFINENEFSAEMGELNEVSQYNYHPVWNWDGKTGFFAVNMGGSHDVSMSRRGTYTNEEGQIFKKYVNEFLKEKDPKAVAKMSNAQYIKAVIAYGKNKLNK